jgi:hypothetical protein
MVGHEHEGERANCEKYFGDAFDAINAFASGQPIRFVP